MKRLAAALKGSTVEWEEEKARRAAEYQALYYQYREDSGTDSQTASSSSHTATSNSGKNNYHERNYVENNCGVFLNPDVFPEKDRAAIREQNARETARGKVHCEAHNTGPSHNTSK